MSSGFVRQSFSWPSLPGANWFPGHMAKAMKQTLKKISKCHCIIEVHDARIPLTGRNPKFQLSQNKKLLVLNKMDLADQMSRYNIFEDNVIWTNCKQQYHSSISNVFKHLLHITANDRPTVTKVMVLGMPNVGKSSLINALRRHYLKKGKATTVGPLPGLTRTISGYIKISDDPIMYLVDTPGIMVPKITSSEIALKLAAIGMLRDHLVGEIIIADYILYSLNVRQNYKYTTIYDLPEPSDNIDYVLKCVSQRIQAYHKGGVLDIQRGVCHFLKQFREGNFGRITF